MKKLIILAVLFLCAGLSYADSIWTDSSNSPYAASKAFRVGDVITVIVLENTSAITKAGTDTNVADSFGASFNHTITRLGIDPSNSLKGAGNNSYGGSGSTTRSSNVTAKIAAVVTKVLANGNLLIQGDHKVDVNGESQTINITGMIRPKDVSLQNTIFSYQVAGAEVSIKGKGTVGDAENPGWFTRFLNWIF